MYNVRHNEIFKPWLLTLALPRGLTDKLRYLVITKADAIVVSWSKHEKDLVFGYRDIGNKKRLM